MVNYKLKSQILEVVENQLKMNSPRCTKQTFNRLVDLGFEASKSKELIASVLVEEMYYVMNNNNPFNEERYAQKLSLLPNNEEDVDNKQESKDTSIPEKARSAIGRNESCTCGSGKKYKRCCGK
ncbi:SEC-C metal-binding domain-containing protein [Bacillus sp. SORGH_AS_0510]|uniref:SEC-C metal-binding domain-containing protein n=1 Tax=Bacillus sp. SORGH_AS_0510 TaxID=3041771 RepID=UPI0027D7F18F|nr:SEC-C metal-binding domain-containing protein [Bacillus sp. SORGH_AS_0510]